METMSQIPGYLTLREAATKIGVSKEQVSRYIKNERLTHVAVGNQYLVPESDVKKFERPDRGNPAFLTEKNPAILAQKKKKRKSA